MLPLLPRSSRIPIVDGFRRWWHAAGKCEFDVGQNLVVTASIKPGVKSCLHAVRCVQDRSRPVVVAREHGLPGGGAFQVHVGRELRAKGQAEAQAAVDAERDAAQLADVAGQRLQFGRQDGGSL